MRIVRCEYEGALFYGRLNGDNIALFRDFPRIGMSGGKKEIFLGTEERSVPFSKVSLEAPCLPRKAVCVGLNYRDHAEEFGLAIPAAPILFIKPSTSLLGPGKTVQYPAMSKRVDYEAELVVVMGKAAKNVTTADALDYVLGYTCGNDVTARDLQPQDGQWTVAKSFDTFMPLGPWIETDVDPSSLQIKALLNGEVRQSSSTANLIFNVPRLIAYISQVMTLEPGDVIMTGTSSGVGPMKKGDHIVVEIESIGRLENIIG
jgi:2-keto-4-pentenoate hydratase/2-oxohepta-3-ene-1,7-dioic acid hydratase in catechol pathway